MAKKLLVIESPAKARTIKKYLGKEFEIMASVGHVKDLPVSKLGVDVEKGFAPEYVTIKGKGKVLKKLKTAAKDAKSIYLGPDPDREGEAIAWHIASELDRTGNHPRIFRVLFNELTARAIRDAVASPQSLDRNKFDAQQARRILDRLVGYQLSPLLWTRVKGGLSAGRVQSVAVKMICDREREIRAFESQEYWSLTAHLEAETPPPFEARFFKFKGKKKALKNETETRKLVSHLKDASFKVSNLVKKQTKKHPVPPFTTSLLQQEAFRRLRFSAKKTMGIAQGLYEGIDLGPKGVVGLITYMRTDSFRLSKDAVSDARAYIQSTYGTDYLPAKPRQFKSRKGAQEAHEAIRPTVPDMDPESIGAFLTKDQKALYDLIWRRFTASQMTPAILDQTQVDIEAREALFRASGSVVVFKGFTLVYGNDAGNSGRAKDQAPQLPPLKEGEVLKLHKLDPAQHFTQPPPRFTEATLIKALEENGIGRPSTYAAILANISGKEYVSIEKRRFVPTELGFLVTDLLSANFPDVLDTAFTAQMENELDKIEQGRAKWTDVLTEFYKTFEKDLKRAEDQMKGELPAGISCPQCDRPMVIKSGKNGIFLACTGYPECKYTTNFTRDEKGTIVVESPAETGEEKGICEKCGRPMVTKNGKYGSFIACSGYPDCRNIWTPEPRDTGVPCPEAGCKGKLVERRSKKGRTFYGCSQYPTCRFATWDPPYDDVCPECHTKVLSVKERKGSSPVLACRKKGCGFTKPLPAA
ncbi:MAG: type I DNA topoisomerase [Deltaproteobacteria bacterium]|nr:type I DNA topoisomerase [Deltaproteobacteria bacterium]